MKFLLRCPKCKNTQQYMCRDGIVKGKTKRCVYCGYSFTIHSSPKKSTIIKKLSS